MPRSTACFTESEPEPISTIDSEESPRSLTRAAGFLAGADPAAVDPAVQGDGRHGELGGQGVQPPLVGPGFLAGRWGDAVAGEGPVAHAWREGQLRVLPVFCRCSAWFPGPSMATLLPSRCRAPLSCHQGSSPSRIWPDHWRRTCEESWLGRPSSGAATLRRGLRERHRARTDIRKACPESLPRRLVRSGCRGDHGIRPAGHVQHGRRLRRAGDALHVEPSHHPPISRSPPAGDREDQR